MNKQALKLKQKRRAEKEAMKAEKINKVWNEISQYNNETGKISLKKTKEQMLKVYTVTKEINKKISCKTGVISLVCSLITLYKYYNFDKESILKYASILRKFIISIGENKRPISESMEEIERDYNVPIMERCQNLPRLKIDNYNKYNMEEIIIKSTVDNFPYFITINAYVFMNYLAFTLEKSWNTEDLELFISKAFKFYEIILTDYLYLKTLNNILINELHISVNLNTGTVSKIIK